MDAASIALLARRIADDPALQRSLAETPDLTGMAHLLAEIATHTAVGNIAADNSAADWHTWLRHAQSHGDAPAVWQSTAAPPVQWLPIRLVEVQSAWQVEWVHGLFAPLSDPFFETSINRIRRHPANLILRCTTPIAALSEFASRNQPDVLVFHISRCGSTLVAQMFGALGDTRVLSEPPVLDEAIQLYLRGLIDAGKVRGLAGALGRADEKGAVRQFVIKFDSWHCLALDRIANLFPSARTVLLIRDPIEVLVSHRQNPGMQVLQGAVPFEIFGLAGAFDVDREDFPAWAMAGIMQGVLAAADRARLLMCDYADLPGAFAARILPHCGIDLSVDAIEAALLVARHHSKHPGAAFEPDAAARQEAADPALRAQAARYGLPQTYDNLRLHLGQKDRSAA